MLAQEPLEQGHGLVGMLKGERLSVLHLGGDDSEMDLPSDAAQVGGGPDAELWLILGARRDQAARLWVASG